MRCHVLLRKPCFSPLSSSRPAHAQSLSTRLMSSPMPLPLFATPPHRAQKEVRQRAQGFSCEFRHFLPLFSKYFLPHVSTLFNMLHGRVFAWREGGVGWGGTQQQRCTGSKQKVTPRNCLQMNELSQGSFEVFHENGQFCVQAHSSNVWCVVYME